MEEFAHQFGVSLGKLLAQGLTFFIVYSILKKFAFGPVMAMLETRRQRIADGEANLDKIAKDLAEAEKNAQAIIDKANADGNRMIKEAGDSAKALAEKLNQEAIHEASQVKAKAAEAALLETEKARAELKREFGRMVADATSRVTGKVLNDGDKATINKESAAQVAA
jgi:F-type H+-transporting ATPase subunit b